MGENPRAQSPISQCYLSHQAHSSNQTFNVSMQDEDDTDCSPHSRRILECQKISDRISTFCDQENLPQRVSFLNQELSVFGYPPIKSEHDESCASSPKATSPNGFVNLVTLVNISYDLLRLWRQSMESQNEANDLQRTSESEIVRLKHIASRLKEDIALKDRDLKSKELLEHQLSQRLENLKKKLKAEQEKARRLTSEMTARDTQFKHEKKKKVQEIEKLQTRLHQLLQDKRQERMLGIEILNSLQRSDGKRGKWNTDRTKKNNEQDMYRLIINNYEDAQRQLLKENAGMRKYLKEMQDELISALNERTNTSYDQTSQTAQDRLDESGERRPRSRTSSNASNASEKSDVSEPMSEGMFEMPYDLVKEDIEKSIRAKWKALKKEIRQTRKMNKRPPIAKGKANGDEYADLVHQQQELINYLTAGQGGSNERPIPEDSYFLEEKAELEKERSDFKSQKHALEKERKLYAEALLQLDEQRQAFEFEKSQWFQHNFLQLTPFRNEGRPSSSPHHNPRSKNSSSHQSRSSRQQPYHPRPSISPDKSSKASNHSSHNGTTRTPNGIDQCFSRLHSSSNRGSFSPDHPRRVEADWSNITPEQKISGFPHKAKSTPTNAIHQPSTAELYRKLGLVYDGSNKENEEMDNTGNERLPPQHEKRITSTSKSEHERHIRHFHHKMKSATPPSGGVKLSPELDETDQTDCSAIARSCDSSYFSSKKAIMSAVNGNGKHKHQRSISEPKEGLSLSTIESLHHHVDSYLHDTVLMAAQVPQKREKYVVVEDLKTALFQD